MTNQEMLKKIVEGMVCYNTKCIENRPNNKNGCGRWKQGKNLDSACWEDFKDTPTLPRKIFKRGNVSLRILNSGKFLVYDNNKEVGGYNDFNVAAKKFCDTVDTENHHLCSSPNTLGRLNGCDNCWLGCGYVK